MTNTSLKKAKLSSYILTSDNKDCFCVSNLSVKNLSVNSNDLYCSDKDKSILSVITELSTDFFTLVNGSNDSLKVILGK